MRGPLPATPLACGTWACGEGARVQPGGEEAGSPSPMCASLRGWHGPPVGPQGSQKAAAGAVRPGGWGPGPEQHEGGTWRSAPGVTLCAASCSPGQRVPLFLDTGLLCWDPPGLLGRSCCGAALRPGPQVLVLLWGHSRQGAGKNSVYFSRVLEGTGLAWGRGSQGQRGCQ